jgi:mannose-6-phosphate isomerase-like protein (cupin superfamily)
MRSTGESAPPASRWHVTVQQASQQTPPPGNLAVPLLQHASLVVEYYAPDQIDQQQPHTRDELYVIAAGSGAFRRGAERVAFGPGDLLHVPAGVVHRFEDFSSDFATWVIFYGPEGGENPDNT